jgi:hypothetical protein
MENIVPTPTDFTFAPAMSMLTEGRKRRLKVVSPPARSGNAVPRHDNNNNSSSTLKSEVTEVKKDKPKRIRNYRPLNYFTR